LIARFRNEVKEHYYNEQLRRCCYCSVELQRHKGTYDAEHVLDQSDYVEYMFEPENLAAACKLCNGTKSNQSVAANGLRFTALSRNSLDYTIVHPHLDEWNDHLAFDSIGRILAVNNCFKGRETIRICGIDALNLARLADEFSFSDRKDAESALRAFHEVKDVQRRTETVELLEIMAHRAHSGARAVVAALRNDLRHLEDAQIGPNA